MMENINYWANDQIIEKDDFNHQKDFLVPQIYNEENYKKRNAVQTFIHATKIFNTNNIRAQKKLTNFEQLVLEIRNYLYDAVDKCCTFEITFFNQIKVVVSRTDLLERLIDKKIIKNIIESKHYMNNEISYNEFISTLKDLINSAKQSTKEEEYLYYFNSICSKYSYPHEFKEYKKENDSYLNDNSWALNLIKEFSDSLVFKYSSNNELTLYISNLIEKIHEKYLISDCRIFIKVANSISSSLNQNKSDINTLNDIAMMLDLPLCIMPKQENIFKRLLNKVTHK